MCGGGTKRHLGDGGNSGVGGLVLRQDGKDGLP
jgi:hypothetical protein